MARRVRPGKEKGLTDSPGPATSSEETLNSALQDGADPEGPGEQKSDAPEMSNDEVLKCINGYYDEAFAAKKTRMLKNKKNQMAYMDQQDFSHKQPGQSAEFLPKISTSAEQFSAFLKRSLVQFGDWFTIGLSDNSKPYITDEQIKKLVKLYIHNIPDGENKFRKFESIIADAGKAALLDSLIILKVHGRKVTERVFSTEPGEHILSDSGVEVRGDPYLKTDEKDTWRLCIDMVKPEDYFPDPTGNGLYEIHETERDYFKVLDLAKQGIYDIDVVKAIKEDFDRDDSDFQKRKPQTLGQNRAEKPGFRKKIVIRECWGTLLNKDGEVVHRNCLSAVANKKYVIRKPEPNPFWHQESPFVTCPLIRVPHSVWHKALYDSASDLNIALNEMFNLMIDGGMAAVWGIKQVRGDYLEDPRQISDGIPQGITLAVKETLPAGEKVLETVSNGAVPQDAMAIYEMLSREFTQAALTNDIKLGSLPPRQVKATEITSAEQNQSVTLDSITADIENDCIEQVLRKSWLNILQHVEDFDKEEIKLAIGPAAAMFLTSTTSAQRFGLFANIATFDVNGLSSMLSRVRDFQKTAGLLQMVSGNPMLMQAFMKNYSIDRILKQALKQLNINPDDIALSQDEMKNVPQIIAQTMLFAQMMAGQLPGQQPDSPGAPGGAPMPIASAGPGGMASPGPGNGAAGPMNEMTSQVNQEANPTTGMRMN